MKGDEHPCTKDGPGRPAEYWKSKDSGFSDYQRFFDHQPEGYRGNERNELIETKPTVKTPESGELLGVLSTSNFDPEPEISRVEVN